MLHIEKIKNVQQEFASFNSQLAEISQDFVGG